MELKPSDDNPELTVLRIDNDVEDEVLRSSCGPRRSKLLASIGDILLAQKLRRSAMKADFYYPHFTELSEAQLRRLSRNVIGRVGNLDALPVIRKTRAEMSEQFSDYLYSRKSD